MSVCVVLNPAAGRGVDAAAFRARLGAILDAEVRVTREAGDAWRIAHDAAAEGFETVAAAGGDGTLSDVVSGLADSFERVRVGFIPIGTGNDFALSAGIPKRFEAAVEVLRGSGERRTDAVRMTPSSGGSSPAGSTPSGRVFLNAAIAGFGGRIEERLDRGMRRRWGAAMYLRAAMSELADIRSYHMHLTIDGSDPVEVEAMMLIVANGAHAGAGIPFARQAAIDDGLLDVVIIEPRSTAAVLRLVPSVLRGTHARRSGVTVRRVTSLGLHSEPAAWVNVDGETAGARPFEFRVLPGALRLAVPD